ncbi:CRE-CDT-1 protein [Caenorhabditis remanei]|uniref:CRE-CDT-1 protein n=1 Tax=Caenorhabditis remanei TaxID=31234 RepID=E3LM37_CAERE|nr:CRE-CDT-1 protein [Caenorhabditis remanei]
MSSRVTRSRSRTETPQTVVTDFFKTTRKPRIRGEKKIIEENEPCQVSAPAKPMGISQVEEETNESIEVDQACVAPAPEEKPSRSRARTPSRNAELSTEDVTGTPPKKSRESVIRVGAPCLPSETPDIILDSAATGKSALDELMEVSGPLKKRTGIRTVADLQARLAAKGAARAVHAQNSKNKAKMVEEHAEMLKSPKKKLMETVSPVKSKAARTLFSPKKSLPDYVVPGFNVTKSAEKIREEQDDAYEQEGNRMTAQFLKVSKLTEDVKESVRQRIELPSTYEHLADSFKRVDQIAGIFLGQNRTCLASELFKSVKSTSGREFSSYHLSQILHVYPEAFHVEMREQRKAFGQGGKYELEIRPNLIDDLRGYILEKTPVEDNDELPLVCPSKLLSPKKSPRKKVQPVARQPDIDGKIRLDAARQRDRAHIFRHKLTTIVMKHHEEFLESQGFLSVSGIKRMHPLFRLDVHCPKLPQVKLPEPPHQKSSVHMGMKEALEKQIDLEKVSLPASVQRLISDLKSPIKTSTGPSAQVPLSPKKFSEMQAEQKSKGTMTLLERIRAKEAIKKAADALVDKDLEKRRQRLTLLKERYVRIVCNHYTSKRAQTMELDAIAKFVQFSSSTPSTIPDIIDHLKLMCEVAPMYVAEAIFMNKKYLRFSDNNIEAINEILVEELGKTQEKIDAQRNNQIAQMSHTPRPKAARSLKFH